MSPLSPDLSRASDEPTRPADPLLNQAAGLADALAADWQAGQRRPAEDYVARLDASTHGSRPQAALRIIYEEVCQRHERGEDVSLTELRERFPQWAEELALVHGCHRVLGLTPHGSRFPEVGDTLGEFRILVELGRGGRGRVYLAEQAVLAGRLMVLKLTPSGDREHLNLARLQHTHIVPLYAVRDFPERGLRTLCMPCLGGAALHRLFEHLRPIPVPERTGRDLLAALASASRAGHVRMAWPARGPNRRFLERASYTQAVCWVGLCLAEALQYAHDQGLVHFDIKPSNVLLTADCQPMLLDFHLARGPFTAEDGTGWPGGTPGYMSPEQRAAWLAWVERRPPPGPVDARSDLYSLGLLLREALYGGPAEETTDRLPLPPRPHLSPGLRAILARCLEPDPAQRYPGAALLAEDLRRHLTDRPLVGVRNRSLRERWGKWRRRRPQALTLGLLLAVCLSAALVLGVLALRQAGLPQRDAGVALEDGRRLAALHRYAEAVAAFDRGLERLGEDGSPLADRLHQQRRRAARGQNVEALHLQVERSRYLDEDALVSPDTLRSWEALCRTAWEGRARLLPTEDTGLEPALEDQVRCDLLDVVVLGADCRVRLEPGSPAARQEASSLLDEAEVLFGPSPVLTRQRQALLGQAQPPDVGRTPRTAWEYHALGRWLLRHDDLEGAAAAFDRAVDRAPQDFWPWYGKGLCAQRRQQYDEAVTAFSVCVALAPDGAVSYYNRGLALAARGDLTAAEKDYDRALELDPHLASAALNRAVLALRQGRLDQAEADLTRALEAGADPASVDCNRALVHQAHGNPAAALACLARVLSHNPDHKAALDLQARLRASLPVDPSR